MLNFMELALPLALIILVTLPLIKVFRGKTSARSAKNRLVTHVVGFFTIITGVLVVQLFISPTVFGAEGDVVDLMTGTMAQGLGFLSAALATGMSALGAGVAVAAAAPAAIGAFSENEKNFGKSLIFVALGEGVAIYGLLISILIINKL
ncbi:MAG: ATPase [Tenericutes bacterium GWC2_39_45]|jgi:V/A-type H+-transporting ATPase subunit K|nr:MAG: ATPase [Tenericutes bacterium GWA2_38_26]OHE30390.1 MAG: ATPase [Tenericutes bacterium GWC2_39_45]OHE31426.1 MAG: ATPase [Tenericutes bacterium GWD2_38_27]OHE41069.1 MAG: ATPase [Tenericutes bacterium GWF2_38_8]HBG32405.1 ATPase [Acholeplasmataceae bacterium]